MQDIYVQYSGDDQKQQKKQACKSSSQIRLRGMRWGNDNNTHAFVGTMPSAYSCLRGARGATSPRPRPRHTLPASLCVE